MKSRQRPPLNLTAPDEGADTAAPDAAATGADLSMPAFEAEPDAEPEPKPAESRAERRKRRQSEQAATAEAAKASPAEPEPKPQVKTSLSVPVSVQTDAPKDTSESSELAPLRTALDTVPAEHIRASGGYWTAGLAAALWAGGVGAWAAYEAGFGSAPTEPLRLAFYILVALAPAGLAFLLARAVHQSRLIAAETRRARGLSEALLAPPALAAHKPGEVLVGL